MLAVPPDARLGSSIAVYRRKESHESHFTEPPVPVTQFLLGQGDHLLPQPAVIAG
jgi:hypothetical protein